jgi:hypothetical protein
MVLVERVVTARALVAAAAREVPDRRARGATGLAGTIQVAIGPSPGTSWLPTWPLGSSHPRSSMRGPLTVAPGDGRGRRTVDQDGEGGDAWTIQAGMHDGPSELRTTTGDSADPDVRVGNPTPAVDGDPAQLADLPLLDKDSPGSTGGLEVVMEGTGRDVVVTADDLCGGTWAVRMRRPG